MSFLHSLAYLLGGAGLTVLTLVPLNGFSQSPDRPGKSGPATASRVGLKPEKILSAAAAPVPATAPEAATTSARQAAGTTRDSIYVNPPIAAVFAGGMPALGAYIGANMRYPEAAKQGGVTGRVLVQFILGKDGRVQDAHVISGPGAGLNEEAYRLVWLMPPWEPGRLANGEPVRVNCTLPIMFRAAQ